MKNEVLQKSLLEAIREKIPEDQNIANRLMDILFIGKEAMYRRLRGEVPFSLLEVATISRELDLSVDNILGAITEKSRPFQLKLAEYVNPAKSDLTMLDHCSDVLLAMTNDPNAEMASVSNSIPLFFHLPYPCLNRFLLFKWYYLHSENTSTVPLSEIRCDDELQAIQASYREISEKINAFYIFDEAMFSYMIKDLKYYSSIDLVTEEEIETIKGELLSLLAELEDLAVRGSFKGGGEVQLYISSINFDSSYGYMHSKNFDVTLINAFYMNSVASLDEISFRKMHHWLQSLKRCSTLISGTGEIYRVKYFNEQRALINEQL